MINLDDVTLTHFPDGQPHIKLNTEDMSGVIDITCRIRTPDELFKLVMVSDLLKHKGFKSRLHIKYLMGARMDRRIDSSQPFTLRLVCDIINNAFPDSPVDVFCPHSEAVSLLLNNYKENREREENFYYLVLQKLRADNKEFSLILPDAGAGKRWYNNFNNSFKDLDSICDIVECSKKRDMKTGRLSSFKVNDDVLEKCVIFDDLIDAGGTFTGLAKQLRQKGAKRVELVVCHGIFSKGGKIEGIDSVYTTDSYNDWLSSENFWVYKV